LNKIANLDKIYLDVLVQRILFFIKNVSNVLIIKHLIF